MPAKSAHQPQFVNDEGITLTKPEQEVLAHLFAGYARLVLKGEVGGGLGGGRVLLVRPVHALSADLPAIVKVGQAAIIQREWEAFTRYVHQKVPKVAHIEGEPAFTDDANWGGIRYPLAGDGRFHIKSLGTFCRQASAEDIAYVLEHQLFASMDALWQGAQPVHEFPFGRSLDAILPVNLVVAYRMAGASASDRQPGPPYGVGAVITLADLLVTEVDSVAGEVTLDLPADKEGVAGGQRLRVTAVPDVGNYTAGHLLPWPITGVIQATRNSLFQAQLDHMFKPPILATTETITLPGMGELANPLPQLPSILKQRGDVRIGVVHGDLNLENVLVEYDHKSRNVHLIDFANARRDWVLHDLLRLETNVWLHLVPEEMRRHGHDLADLPHLIATLQSASVQPNQIGSIPGFEKPFHILLAIRHRAQHLLISPQAWDTYWQGLIVYLVGALKFQNLDRLPSAPLPKQVAFVTAILLQQGRQGEPFVAPSPGATRNVPLPNPIPLPDLIRRIRVILQECEPFESQHQLRAFFAHSQLTSWRNRLPEAHRLSARVDGVIALLQPRTHVESGTNALVLLLHMLSQDPNIDQDLQAELAALAHQLEVTLKEEGQATPLEKRPLSLIPSGQNIRVVLLDILERRFSDSELRKVCLYLHIDYESLGGNGKADKARELILYLERRDRLDDLLTAIQRLRPDITQ